MNDTKRTAVDSRTESWLSGIMGAISIALIISKPILVQLFEEMEVLDTLPPFSAFVLRNSLSILIVPLLFVALPLVNRRAAWMRPSTFGPLCMLLGALIQIVYICALVVPLVWPDAFMTGGDFGGL